MSEELQYKLDKEFMKWLIAYDPNWDCRYSGNLEDMYDAYRAGMTARLAPVVSYDAAIVDQEPLVYLQFTERVGND